MMDAIASQAILAAILCLSTGVYLWYNWGSLDGALRRVTIHQVALIYCALYFGGGTLLAYNADALRTYDTGVVFSAWAAVLLNSFFLMVPMLVAGGRVRIGRLDSLMQNCRHTSESNLAFWFLGSVAVRLYMAVAYGFLVGAGRVGNKMEDVSYTIYMLYGMAVVVGYGCSVIAFAKVFSDRGSNLGWVVLAVQFGLQALQGRRFAAEMLVLGALFLFWHTRRLTPKIALIAAASIGFTYHWGLPFLGALRSEWNYADFRSRSHNGLQTLLEIGPNAASRIEEYREHGGDGMSVSQRAYVLDFFLDVAHAQQRHGAMGGESLISSVVWIIPSAFYRNKTLHLPAEQAIQAHYALPQEDMGSNWPLYGFADFGPLGGIVTGLAFGTLLLIGARAALWCMERNHVVLASFVLGSLWHCAVFTDSDPNTILRYYRDIAMLAVPVLGWSFVLVPLTKNGSRSASTRARCRS